MEDSSDCVNAVSNAKLPIKIGIHQGSGNQSSLTK